MLQSKSDDLELLSKLGCDDNEANVDNILRDGLDERMGNSGALGKRIYFSDDPLKSIQYDGCHVIFIFGVLLGDCLSVNHLYKREKLVREPEKVETQKRLHNDLFFDSIVGQTGRGDYNEYVIYNRYQCCPLYKVTYSGLMQGSTNTTETDVFTAYRKKLPTFSWMPLSNDTAEPNESSNDYWPFYTSNLFSLMGVETVLEEKIQATPTKITQQSVDEKLNI